MVTGNPDFSYWELSKRWKALRQWGITVREVACAGAPRTILIAESGAADAACIALSAGVHGDEPAGPWALLSLVESGLLDPRFSYRIWPCTNPTGYAAGTRENAEGRDINRSFDRGGTTPESKAILTANRDRRFVLSLDLHEDVDAGGFYCYEPAQEHIFGRRIIRELDDAGLPVQHLTDAFDLGYPEPADHLRELERGRVVPDVRLEKAVLSGLPYSLYMCKRAARHVMTLEAPATRDFTTRVAILRVAVVSAIAALVKVSSMNCAK